MTEPEPVAYWSVPKTGEEDSYIDFNPDENPNFENIPLYTAEQLHPRVKMTKKQHKQFENYKTDKNSFYHFWQSLLVDDISLFKEFSERELMLVWLNPEATIEIFPEKKWFVRSKESDKDGYYWWLTHTGSKFVPEYMPNKNASSLMNSFDTKKEAEKWTNPLTEAVQLPVEGE